MTRNSIRRFYIETDALNRSIIHINGAQAHHIQSVLRLRQNDVIQLFDGCSRQFKARISAFTPAGVEAEILEEINLTDNPQTAVTLAQGFLKEKKMDLLVRQLSELGVSHWIPFFSARTIPKPNALRLKGRLERWRKIAVEALKQCGRTRVMQIGPVVNYEEMLASAAGSDVRTVFWEKSLTPLNPTDLAGAAKVRRVFTVLGPEGGLTEQEIATAESQGFSALSLGPRILRAETAAVTAAALLQYCFGDMRQKSVDNGK